VTSHSPSTTAVVADDSGVSFLSPMTSRSFTRRSASAGHRYSPRDGHVPTLFRHVFYPHFVDRTRRPPRLMVGA
jgi:hypothetical protein